MFKKFFFAYVNVSYVQVRQSMYLANIFTIDEFFIDSIPRSWKVLVYPQNQGQTYNKKKRKIN